MKVDAKTRAQLDEYLADKNKANGTEVGVCFSAYKPPDQDWPCDIIT